MSNTIPTIHTIDQMTEAELKVVKRRAIRNVATLVAVKVGIAVAVHYATVALINKIDSKDAKEED